MSNPAVVKLCKGRVGKSDVWLDDNYGESIHIHIDDHRVDLTVEEFKKMYNDLCIVLNQMLQIENLDFKKIDPVFLSLYLWPKLDKLEDVRLDNVRLSSLYAPYKNKVYKLSESVGVKCLKGISNENEGYRDSHHIGQTDNERMEGILNSIKENGYPYENNFIIVYGDDNVIRDGQHRASCLYYLKGDIDVPILRFFFRGYKPLIVDRRYNAKPRVAIRCLKDALYPMYYRILSLYRMIERGFVRLIFKVRCFLSKKETTNIVNLEGQYGSK